MRGLGKLADRGDMTGFDGLITNKSSLVCIFYSKSLVSAKRLVNFVAGSNLTLKRTTRRG